VKSPFVWAESTRNHYIGFLADHRVCAVVRAQKHRPDGTPRDWSIQTFGVGVYLAGDLAPTYDPRDLESCKAAAEIAAQRLIDRLYRALHAGPFGGGS
jgi:hypothetical protein